MPHEPDTSRIENRSIPEPNSGCWLWLGAARANPSGTIYGRMTIGSRTDGSRRTYAAHRYSFEAFRGPIPEEMQVCHRCDNGLCVNPGHLFLGTAKDNADDRDRKGRNKPPPTYSNEIHPSTRVPDDVIARIRATTQQISSVKLAKELGMDPSYIRQVRRGLYRRPTPPHTGKE